MQAVGLAEPTGDLATRVLRAVPYQPPVLVEYPPVLDDRRRLDLGVVSHFSAPSRSVESVVNEWRVRNLRQFQRGARRAGMARVLSIPTHFGALFCTKITAVGDVIPYGLVSLRVVTDAGVAAIADAFGNTFEVELFNFHGMGTGTGAEAVGDTALGTELTTEYNPNSTRATGVQTTPTNVYQTVGTNTIDSGTPAITEHGILSQAATGGGTLLDRSKFSAINLASGDGIQFTYQLTFTSGG